MTSTLPPSDATVPHGPRYPHRRGFTLVELLLVTVILGLLASIAAPYVSRAREQAMTAALRADMRNLTKAVEAYATIYSAWPSTLNDLTSSGEYVPSDGIEVCFFFSIPNHPTWGSYIVALGAHEGSSTWAWTMYPREGGQIWEFQSGTQGCP